ncbi:uncharacterized protein MELLADRAFT_32252 [Melampsora larici-populina 98AG31]|uniref:ATP12-domain-containing protein n=1 Tax=Melampsora larici-populina (strain 98AG31 / pathotype 3-4-7) TaxID=747676 RepID=F4R4M4_MELLP|nr:uncharacterized protein MELLADRAFT_32252 [Melampsora larici-populina 98AG31]EGG12972.1 hypothetical protein MELLADRAFT_32252 [Melampsora larici-populina 98AG31]
MCSFLLVDSSSRLIHVFFFDQEAEVSMQRFWKTVDIHPSEDGNFHIRLDQRKLVTPSGNQLVIPRSKIALAVLVAREWAEQRKILKQHSLPLTSLVSRSIDGMKVEDRDEIIDSLLNYLDTDTVCFFEEKPQRLVDLQDKHWKPLIEWISQTYSVNLKIHHDSILFAKQSPATKEALRSVVMHFDRLKLAGFERAVHVTKSFVIALALVEGKLTVDEASDASRVEVLSQIARWGEVEDTHDVDFQEIRMKLGSVTCALI